jgi:hypothetical protein
MGDLRRALNQGIIEGCNCPTYREPDLTNAFTSRNCIRFGTNSNCGEHELEVYAVRKRTSFPRPCGFWEDGYEWVTEIPNQVVIDTFDFHSPPCSGFPDAYRTETITQTRTIDTDCDFGFGDNCCIFESNTVFGDDCVEAGDPFETSTYSGANTLNQHIAAGDINYSGFASDEPKSLLPTFMYGINEIEKIEGRFGFKAVNLTAGLKYKYGYTVWRRVQPQNNNPSWTKVNDVRSSFTATSNEENIDSIPSNWGSLTGEQQFAVGSLTSVPEAQGFEYHVNNFGIIQDFGSTSCNAWQTGVDDGTSP